MILLHVLSEDAEQLDNIAADLLKNRLIATANIDYGRSRFTISNGEIKKVNIHVLTAATKALLFETIDNRLRHQYSEKMPEVFSTPIIHIDWDLAKSLIEYVEKV